MNKQPPIQMNDDPLASWSPSKGRRFAFVAAVLTQLLIVTSFAGSNAYTLYSGNEVTLKAQPVDPWDPFRGYYMAMTYDISQLPSNENLSPGQEVYAVLKKNSPYWTAESISLEPVKPNDSRLSIKARVEYKDWASRKYKLHFGTEQAYMEEGQNKRLRGAKSFTVKVMVDASGHAIVKSVTSNG